MSATDPIVGVSDKRRRFLALDHDVVWPLAQPLDAGWVVVAQQRKGKAEVVEVLGHEQDPALAAALARFRHGLPHRFSAEAEAEAAGFDVPPLGQRQDLRHLAFITIDGEDARDFDDAVYAQASDQGFELWVAIADVAHYVREGSAIDQAASERGTSVYFADSVIPMLPEALSNHLCSLKPDLDRAALVAHISLNRHGEVLASQFSQALIRSCARLSYNEAFAQLQQPPRAKPYRASLAALHALYRQLVERRYQRGALDLESPEIKAQLEQGQLLGFRLSERNTAHKLIEECMLLANVAAAQWLEQHQQHLLYRVHDEPPQERLERLELFLSERGYRLEGHHVKDFSLLLRQFAEHPKRDLFHTAVLRSQSKAVYSPHNQGHFGLGYSAYAHFTSPIRRYPDLLVHRAITAVLAGGRYQPLQASWQELGESTSASERRADEASRAAEGHLKALWASAHIGHIGVATITGVTEFGVFVLEHELLVEGLIHISQLGSGYLRYERQRQRLIGRAGAQFDLGDQLEVELVRASPLLSQVDFRRR